MVKIPSEAWAKQKLWNFKFQDFGNWFPPTDTLLPIIFIIYDLTMKLCERTYNSLFINMHRVIKKVQSFHTFQRLCLSKLVHFFKILNLFWRFLPHNVCRYQWEFWPHKHLNDRNAISNNKSYHTVFQEMADLFLILLIFLVIFGIFQV